MKTNFEISSRVLLSLSLSAVVAAFLAGAANAAAFEKTVEGFCVGPVKVACAEPGGWTFEATRGVGADGVEELEIALAAPSPRTPPKFSVSFDFAAVDAHHKWTGGDGVKMPPNWEGRTSSYLCCGIPLVAFLNDGDRNRATVACAEAKRPLYIDAGYREEDSHLVWKLEFFVGHEAPLSAYRTKIRFDRRDVFFGDAIASASKWISETSGLVPAKVPDAAFDPLYSTWYSFHQNLSDKAIEAECAEAAKLGMKTLIVDDGWQTDDNHRGYAFSGDWQVSKRRFPDMAAHVKRVHDLGMKYLVWYSVPFVGKNSANYARFRGKYLYERGDAAILDPRFPEVRKFLCETYAKAMRDWDLDGFKLDFIDSFGTFGEDPAVKENYAGRDIEFFSDAVDRLMKDVYATLAAIKPDVLVEFRQSYFGPGIRQYGNMLRAGDCPGDLMSNRLRIANLRLTSGGTAVHADMLEWHGSETAESAARFVLSSIFGVVQYSVMLRDVPADHKRMIAHWIKFSTDHRETLLKGAFRPHHFEANYPVIEAESAAERIVAVYNDATVADCGAADKPVYVLNATGRAGVALRLASAAKGVLYDTFGNKTGEVDLKSGVQDVAIPASGYLQVLSSPVSSAARDGRSQPSRGR